MFLAALLLGAARAERNCFLTLVVDHVDHVARLHGLRLNVLHRPAEHERVAVLEEPRLAAREGDAAQCRRIERESARR